MCAHYTIFIEQEELRDIVAAAQKNLAVPTLNFKMGTRDIHPGYGAPVVVPNENVLMPEVMRWGYPLRSKKKRQTDPNKVQYTISYAQNAMLEEALDKPFWRDSLEKRRCLIPVSGFYEYNKKKTPYYFTMPAASFMYVAGIFKTFKDEDGNWFPFYSMMTTKPNQDIARIHDRMPVVLNQEETSIWLHGDFMSMVDRSGVRLQARETTREEMFAGK